MNDFLQALKEASRPFKQFEFKIGEQDFQFATRILSDFENDMLSKTFTQEFDKIASQMEAGNIDTSVLKRGLQKQSKESLAKLIVRADHQDYLQEASTELDDKPFNDNAVVELAKEKEATALDFLLKANDEEVLSQALERRAFVVAMIKATDAQNLHFLAYSVYRKDNETAEWVPAFNDSSEVSSTLDRDTIRRLINEVYTALRGAKVADPLKPRARKRPEKLS